MPLDLEIADKLTIVHTLVILFIIHTLNYYLRAQRQLIYSTLQYDQHDQSVLYWTL